jgi:hypothetical protein
MVIRLEAHDELMHDAGDEATFNESMYFNIYDPSARIGGFFRLGNRANEGYAEMTTCLYLPDGRVGFMFQRPKIDKNDAFDSGGMRFEVVRPFEELRVSYEGNVVLLDDPLAMADPKEAFTQNPHSPAHVELTYSGVSTMFGGEPDVSHEAPGQEFAKAHYEQLIAGSGTISVGDDTWEVNGYGLRDHSWGPRTWQAPFYYRWLTANFGPSFGFMGSRVARRDSDGIRGGFVWDGTALRLCDGFKIETTWVGDEHYHAEIDATLTAGNDEWRVHGKVLSLIPLRNRREGQVTRISEALTEWTTHDGRVGYGLSEYLDQIIDGKPVGIDE